MFKKKIKKKAIIVLTVVIILTLTAVSPLGSYGLSLGAMKIYSASEAENSYMNEKGIHIDMPSANGWYPFVMTFNADSEFRRFTSGDAEHLTIMYNFPGFDLKKGCSRIYDDESPYYSSFYGAYCVDGNFGFGESGELDEKMAGMVPEYDYTKLVLRDLGLPEDKQVFDWKVNETEEDVYAAGIGGWQTVDAELTVNGLLHEKKDYLRNYVQYGIPKYESDTDFAPIRMKGKVYGKYFAEKDVSIYFYVIAANEKIIAQFDSEILKNSKISQ
ncbi:MAG: hypothetical protein UC708_05715 [Anaerovoracaceae bacterium]|nr:hypothetical protein [Bacillota bacterium]MEE0517361.1 hypothetical protein [Anaerovoracaceae bacterium]